MPLTFQHSLDFPGEREKNVQGFFPGNTPQSQKILHLAQNDAEWCIANQVFGDIQSYPDLCNFALRFVKQKTYPAFYTDHPKRLYESYVYRFALVAATSLHLEVPEHPEDVWEYLED